MSENEVTCPKCGKVNRKDSKYCIQCGDSLEEAEKVSFDEKYRVDICGEGGEYESLVVDAPWFKQRIKITNVVEIWDGVSGRYIIKNAELVPK